MSNRVEFSPEIVRMAQTRVRDNGGALASELARLAVEEVITQADVELGLMLEHDETLSSIDALVSTIGANDVVVNGKRIDVRAADDEGYVSVCKALVGTPAVSSGSLVVELDGTKGATIIGHVSSGGWMGAEEQSKETDRVSVKYERKADFDAVSTIKTIVDKVQISLEKAVSRVPEKEELQEFVNKREKLIVARQKQIVTALCARADVRAEMHDVVIEPSHGLLTRVLQSESQWNRRTEEMVDKLSPKFKSLTRDELKKHVTACGEEFGGQPEAPKFRKAVIKKATIDQLTRQFGGARVKEIAENMLAGKTPAEAVKQMISNNVAVDIAVAIRKKRDKVQGFAAATAEEIGMAMQGLALQPAYATHSSKDAGLDSINEALELLEATEIVEAAMALEEELISD